MPVIPGTPPELGMVPSGHALVDFLNCFRPPRFAPAAHLANAPVGITDATRDRSPDLQDGGATQLEATGIHQLRTILHASYKSTGLRVCVAAVHPETNKLASTTAGQISNTNHNAQAIGELLPDCSNEARPLH